ncbi:MAG TPA: hypothetical protein DCY07_03895 [Rhodospirillaceae bacterium]|nr:hypothetical protein [Rhodospirillaceae bacterium]
MTRATTIFFWFSLILFVSLGLYHTSYRVENLGRQLRSLNTQITSEQRTLHVLKAEWVFLANPTRLEAAAKKHLALQPTSPSQISKMTKLAYILPTRDEAMGTTTVAAAPIANLHLRPAARSPKATGQEKDRLNTRMIIGKTASAEGLTQDQPLPMGNGQNAYTLANSGDAP